MAGLGVKGSRPLLLIIVIGMFPLSSITFIKLLGVGMIVAGAQAAIWKNHSA